MILHIDNTMLKKKLIDKGLSEEKSNLAIKCINKAIAETNLVKANSKRVENIAVHILPEKLAIYKQLSKNIGKPLSKIVQEAIEERIREYNIQTKDI